MEPKALTTLLAYGIAVVLGGLLLCLGAMYFVGWAGRRAGCRGGITVIAQMLTPVALVFVGSVYLDVAGAVATGRLESKDERILYGSPLFWSRAFFATVAFESQTGPAKALLWLDEATFDALTLTSPVQVRYLRQASFIARLANRSTAGLVPWSWFAWAAAFLGAGMATRRLLRGRSLLTQGAVVGGGGLIGLIGLTFPTPWDTPLDGPVMSTTAEVRAMHAQREALFGEGQAAPQPWDLVELRFVPAGRPEPVIAVDDVDAGSVAGLAVGAHLPVSYRVDAPRSARLQGRRTYRWREWWHLGKDLAALAALFAVLTTAPWLWRRVTGPRAPSRTP